MNWRYVGASISGTSHNRLATPCQDAHVIRCRQSKNGEVLWAILADGAGSSKFSELGAEIACNCYATQIERWLVAKDYNVEELDCNVVTKLVKRVRKSLLDFAKHQQNHARDYACTLLGIVVGIDYTVCFQIGDGGIVVSQPDGKYGDEKYRIVFWPENAEYVNVTHFLTDETAVEHLCIEILPYTPRDVALFTDGIQSLALHFVSRTVFAPFFTPMFQRLLAESPGYTKQSELELIAFLESPKVNERTDDDKTLILVTR